MPICLFYNIFFSKQLSLWPILPLGLIKFSGIVVSTLLLVQGTDSKNAFIQNLCSLDGKNDCDTILKSDASKITPWLSWSEAGFFYFAGSFLFLLLNSSATEILTWVNIFTLPFTFYSIYYQSRTKNWCILCCSAQALLWLEFFTARTAGLPSFNSNIPDSSVVVFAMCFLSPAGTWVLFKPFFLNSSKLKPVEKQFKTVKYNAEIFSKALVSQPHYAVTDELMPIVLGNQDAKTVITIISDPFCIPCGKAHKTLGEWLSCGNDFKVKVLFTTANHKNDPITRIAKHLTALSTVFDVHIVEEALNKWYEPGSKYESWAAKYPVIIDQEIDLASEKQKTWCEMADITFTPTILVNGYKLPHSYQLEDLKYLID